MVNKTTVGIIASVAAATVASILVYLYIESQKDKKKTIRRKFSTVNDKTITNEKKTEATNNNEPTKAKVKGFEGKILEGFVFSLYFVII